MSKLLITGGTGSFGNAVLNRFLNTVQFTEIRIFSRDEKKQEDMRIKYKNDILKFYIGDTRSYQSISEATMDVDYIFCAAALKQVPSCEFYPMEAIKTNILGTENTLNAAITNQVKKIIVLSTDKAVYPRNVMGMTKALMEKIAIAKSNNLNNLDNVITITRYGNVMGSRGSVIPLFIDQCKNGLPITITDANMTRFMMSLNNAVDLVLYAFEHGEQGDTLVQKAPATTVKILAESIKEIFNSQSEIIEIGTRHGEKLYESLLTREEFARSEDVGNFYRVPKDSRSLNYNIYTSNGNKSITNSGEYTSHNTQRLNKEEMKALLLRLDIVNDALAKG